MYSYTLGIIHTIIIVSLFIAIITHEKCSLIFFALQLALTAGQAFLEKRLKQKWTTYQLAGSISLIFNIFGGSKLRFLSWVFFLKAIDMHQYMKTFRTDLIPRKFKYLWFFFDFIRFTFNEYTFLGLVMVVYRYFANSLTQPIPETYILLYQMAVTASTIGYGDITPKSKEQMIFMTFAIPIVCSSFVVYSNSLLESFNESFLQQEQKEE